MIEVLRITTNQLGAWTNKNPDHTTHAGLRIHNKMEIAQQRRT